MADIKTHPHHFKGLGPLSSSANGDIIRFQIDTWVEAIWNLRLASATVSHLPGLPIIYLSLTFSHIPFGSSSFPN